jgi:hypothetical protein
MRSEAETIEMESTEEYRTNTTVHLVRISGDVEHMKESLASVLMHLEKINGRLRYTENSISAIKAIGITITTFLTIAIALIGVLK